MKRACVVIVAAIAASWPTSAMAQGPVTTDVQVAHLVIDVRRPDGDPVAYLRSKNFSISIQGRQLPITSFERPHPDKAWKSAISHTRVLLIMSREYQDEGNSIDTLAAGLPGSFGADEVGALTSDGRATEYFRSPAELYSGLRGAIAKETIAEALDKLGVYAGPRAVIYLTSKQGRTPLFMRQLADKTGTLIYQVGGNPADNYTFDGDQSSTRALPEYGQSVYGANAPAPGAPSVVNNVTVWESFATRSISNVYVERTIGGAFHDIRSTNKGYYGLSILVPVQQDTLDLRLSLDDDYQVIAQTYASDSRPGPEIKVLGRIK